MKALGDRWIVLSRRDGKIVLRRRHSRLLHAIAYSSRGGRAIHP